MPAKSKRTRKLRTAQEFDLSALIHRLTSQRVTAGAYSWTLGEIQNARKAQERGDFRLAARLAEAFMTDSAMFVAKRTRLGIQRSIPVKMVPANESTAAKKWCNEADALFGPNGVGVTPETMVSIDRHLTDHGVAFAVNTWTPREDGSRVDVETHAWPIEFVRWDAYRGCYVTQIDTSALQELPLSKLADGSYGVPALPLLHGSEVEIHHGDGRWNVFEGEELEPWKAGCVLPGALVWASHAFGFRDMNKSSAAHGNVKVMGMLPEGIPIDSAEGAAYLDAILALLEGSSPAGIQPHGAKTEFMASPSGAYQIFKEIIMMSRSDASQIYNGHDGMLGTNGAGPGVDLETLLKISNGNAEGGLHTIERRFGTGTIEPWAAINSGDSSLAPRREYQIPDTDQNLRREAASKQRTAFYDAIERERALKFDVTEERIAYLASEHGVTPAALLPVPTTPAPATGPAAATAPTALPAPAQPPRLPSAEARP
jgi:hypothetical protein